ncbi:Poly(A) RNA polymerase GLD2-A [Toxocara canis]|uniref:Poly(A) RNA polymerase GLD2-A n=1 Tax=Toxocara canis TaxID=6265 RepID=A0A0B2VIX6_TOXCA|nr:Poly(A) RNA polymerase GLD2-A [Toxocara canis]
MDEGGAIEEIEQHQGGERKAIENAERDELSMAVSEEAAGEDKDEGGCCGNAVGDSSLEGGRKEMKEQSAEGNVGEVVEGTKKVSVKKAEDRAVVNDCAVTIAAEGEEDSEGWIVESADGSVQEDESFSDEEGDGSPESSEVVERAEAVSFDDATNFWCLLRACARGEQRIGRFTIDGLDYVVMGDVAFKCSASTNLINCSAAKKKTTNLLHTVDEVFLLYMHYTRSRFRVYSRKMGALHKRKIDAAAAARLEEYLYVPGASLPAFVSGMYPPPVPINLTELLRADDIVQLPASGWNQQTCRQKFALLKKVRLTRNPNNALRVNSSLTHIPDGCFEPSDDHSENIYVPQISHSDFINSEVHRIEHRRPGRKVTILEGTFYGRYCYTQFLSSWLCHMKRTSHVAHSMVPVTIAQRLALGLSKSQPTVAHTYMVIEGLPPSEFYGGGFGVTQKLANWAASRELVTRLYHNGLVTPSQYNAIEEVPKSFLEGNASDLTVNRSVIEKVKRAIVRASSSIRSVENNENALIRRKRRAIDLAEQDVIAAKRNKMVTVLPEEVDPQMENLNSAVSKGSNCADNCTQESTGAEEVADFIRLFDEEGSTVSDNNKLRSPASKGESSRKASDGANAVSNVPEKVIKFVSVFDDKPLRETNGAVASNEKTAAVDDDQDCICVAEVRSMKKQNKEIPLIAIDEDDTVQDSSLQQKPEPKYVPEISDTQAPSTSFSSEATGAEQFNTNTRDDNAGGEMDMEVEEGSDEIVINRCAGKDIAEPHPYNGPSNTMQVRKQKDMELCQRLGVTNVASALDVYGAIKGRRKKYPQGFDAFDSHIWRHYRLNGQDDRTFSWKMEVRERLLALVRTVPILKLEMGNEYSELEIDINCNNVAGIYNSHLLHYYARIDDRFPALCLLVKHWAINAGINDAMSGTFNSYSLILMVLHFLQCATMPPVLPNLQQLHPDIFNGCCGLENLELFRSLPPLPARELNRSTVGELLIAFFDYYAKFDFANKAISVHRGCVFDRSDLAISTRRFKVFIEEPFDHQNTARCVTRLENLRLIKRAFISARNAFLGSSALAPRLELIDVH